MIKDAYKNRAIYRNFIAAMYSHFVLVITEFTLNPHLLWSVYKCFKKCLYLCLIKCKVR